MQTALSAKAQDHSAVAIAELSHIEQNGRDQTRADVVHLERLPKGAKYTEQMERLAVLRFNTIPELNHCPLIVDSSGVGAGVTDVMEDEFNLSPTSVTITGGDSSRQDDETHRWRVSKLALVNVLLNSPHF